MITSSTELHFFKVKIIFLGDPCQLPPIKEYISKSFKLERIFWLTEILRQKENNPLLDILQIARKDVLSKTGLLLQHLLTHDRNINDKGEGYTVLNKKAFNQVMNTYVKDQKEPDDVRYVSYTRSAADNHNVSVHRNLHNYSDAPKVLNGDIMTAHTTLVDDFMTPILVNSLDYVVEETLEYRTEDDIDIVAVKLFNTFENTSVFDTFFIVKHDIDNLTRLVRLLQPLYAYALGCKGHARKVAWVEYYKLKNRYLLLFDIEYKNFFLEKDLSFGYGLTTYKSQGSTYSKTFIDLNDITSYRGEHGKWIKKYIQ